jgi:hypothetical protein
LRVGSSAKPDPASKAVAAAIAATIAAPIAQPEIRLVAGFILIAPPW